MNKNHDPKGWMFQQGSMVKRTRFSICLLLLQFSCSLAFAQSVSVKATADRNSILIGEPIQLQVEARLPPGNEAKWFIFDSIPHFEYIEKAKIDTVQNQTGLLLRQTVTVTSFDSGRWVIPPLELDVNGRTYITDSFPVAVAFSDFNSAGDYHDIKDILEVTSPEARYITWAIAAITLLSLLAVIYFLRKRTAAVIQPVRQPAGAVSPFEEAMQLLEQLKREQLPERGEVKTYYTRMNDILRAFLLRRMGMTAMQKTNEELILQVAQTALANDQVISLAQALRMSDAVKFARFVPGAADNGSSFNTIRTSIEQINNLPA
jgi:hypothetical protein